MDCVRMRGEGAAGGGVMEATGTWGEACGGEGSLTGA